MRKHPVGSRKLAVVFERLAGENFAYLTTTGRRTGKPHTIEIWFALTAGHVYLLAGGRDSADWIKNIRHTPDVRLRIGSRSTAATARILTEGTREDALARELLDGKYQGWREGKRLSAWAKTALPVAVDLDQRRGATGQ